jgi:hypothetical protein
MIPVGFDDGSSFAGPPPAYLTQLISNFIFRSMIDV